ncbi:MAG TPA: FtsW/RodA/SpoVE family cell cycle protein [Aggregatilineaceae bacterium]|nr:FtsW/RodA/SpoVE family cell cycle protein [Aggregatilineaceae bacterium]
MDSASLVAPHLDLDSDAAPRPMSQERALLILAGLFVLINQVTLIIAAGRSVLAIWPVGVWVLCAAGGHRSLNRRLPFRDPLLFPVTMFMTGWGLNLVARLVPDYAPRQTLWVVVGLVALLALTTLPKDLRWLRRYRYTWLTGGLALLALTILIGQNPANRGPRLWLGFGGLYYQPSELLKILLVAFLASYFAENQRYMREDTIQLGPWRVPSPAFLGPVLLMWGICIVMLVWQRDLGAATLFFVVFMVMLYVASGQAQLFIGGLALLLVAAVVGYHFFEVVALRVKVWLDPWPQADRQAYQVVQSLLAVSAGGLFGQGIGQGYPTIIPVAYSDFAFAAIAEEWGLIGVLVVVIGLAALVVRGMRIAVRARQPFRSLLAAGLSVMLAVQSLLIMAGVLKLVPLTGITLPFVSYGGSSLLTNFVIAGLLLVLSDEERAEG